MLKDTDKTLYKKDPLIIDNSLDKIVIPKLITDFCEQNSEELELIKKIVLECERIILLTHQNMDLDAIGSTMTIYSLLRKIKKNVIALTDRTPPEPLEFLKVNSFFKTTLPSNFKPDLAICLDTSTQDYLGIPTDGSISFNDFPSIIIDHHLNNKMYGDINIVGGNFSSVCEVVFAMIVKYGLLDLISKKEATLLYAGIVGDNSIFKKYDTLDGTHYVCGSLIRKGADNNLISENHQKKTPQRTKLLGKLLSNYSISNDGKVIWSKIKLQDFIETGANEDDVLGLIEELTVIEGCKTSFLLHEREGGFVRGSLRSKEYDVGKLATSLKGGGHKQAAGFTFEGNIEEIEKYLLNEFKIF